MWTVVAAVGDGVRSGASWLCLGPAVRGKRWWCLWCRYWTGACWSIVAAEGEGTVDGGVAAGAAGAADGADG